MGFAGGWRYRVGVVGLALACLWGGSLPLAAEEVYIHNRPFKRVLYQERSLYAPLEELLQALRVTYRVRADGRVFFQREAPSAPQASILTGGGAEGQGGLNVKAPREIEAGRIETSTFTAEYAGVVFPVEGMMRDGEVWVPVRQLAEHLGLEVKSNPQTGIIDILRPRQITDSDRWAAQELAQLKEERIEAAEELLAERRAQKIARQQEAAKKAAQAKAKKSPAKKSTNQIKRKRVTVSAEGDFPSQFNDDIALQGVTPRRAARRAAPATPRQSAPQLGQSPDGTVYPKAAPRPKAKAKQAAPQAAPKKAESAPKAQSTPAPAPPGPPFVAYSNPQVQVDYSNGDFNYSATLLNRSQSTARQVWADLQVKDSSGQVVSSQRVQAGDLEPGQSRQVSGRGRHPQRGSMPRSGYYLDVKLEWAK